MLRQAVALLFVALPLVAQTPAFDTISMTPARSGEPGNMRLRVLANDDLSASAPASTRLELFAASEPCMSCSKQTVGPDEIDSWA